MKTGIELIAQERKEQIEKHKWSLKEDLYYSNGELKQAAIYCLTLDEKDYPQNWGTWFKLNITKKKERMSETEFEIEMSRISGALSAANIDRLQDIKNS